MAKTTSMVPVDVFTFLGLFHLATTETSVFALSDRHSCRDCAAIRPDLLG
jgi:hypothetical protein